MNVATRYGNLYDRSRLLRRDKSFFFGGGGVAVDTVIQRTDQKSKQMCRTCRQFLFISKKCWCWSQL